VKQLFLYNDQEMIVDTLKNSSEAFNGHAVNLFLC